jgi:nucleoside-diphosphate-sugar epimerase
MNVLVVGLGYVGGPLAAALARRGHRVLGLRRSDGPAPEGVRIVRGDVTSPETWTGSPGDFDQVVVLLSAGERSEAAYERTYLAGAKSVRARFPQSRVLWVSSTAVYVGDADSVLNDDTSPDAQSGTGGILRRAEEVVATGPHLIVRPSGIYGPGRTTLLERLRRADVADEERDVWTNRIHQEDLIRCLTFCVERPELRGSLLASDCEPAQLGSMQAWVLSEVGSAPPALGAAARGPRASAEPRRSRLIQPTRLAQLGFEWKYPSYREGYRALLDA